MSGRRRWVALAVAIIVVVAGAATLAVIAHHPHKHARAVASPPRPPALRTLATTSTVPAPAQVAATLRAAVRAPALGGGLHADVVDNATGRELFSLGPDITSAPASTAKLLTAAAALDVLGPGATLSTGVVRSGDTLYLIGGGDVTLARAPRPSYPPTSDIGELAARTVSALGGVHDVRLCVDTDAWTGPPSAPGWNHGYFSDGDIAPVSALEVDEGQVRAGHRPRVGDPAAAAAAAFTAALRAGGVDVQGTVCRGSAPASGLGLASVPSAPVAALVQRMLTDSDNDLAEALGRAVAARTGHPAGFAGEAVAITAAVQALGIDTSGLRLYDASGLSRLDRVSVRTMVQLLQLAASDQHPALRPLVVGLPVAGFTGTLADRYRRPPAASAAGLARAKTGTLAGVNAIAGYVVDAGGRLLVFAFATDRATGPDATEAALDRIVGRLSACGCG